MRPTFPLLSLALTASLLCAPMLAPNRAHAGSLLNAAPAEAPAEDPALAEARSLYKQGEDSFDTGEFTASLDLWKRAYAILPDGEDTRAIRHALVYNIAEAHSRAYEVSRNPTHLRTAKVMLETYRSDHRSLYGDEPESVKERAEVDDRIAELDKKIEASVAANEQAYPLEGSAGAALAPTPTAEPGQEQPMPQPTAKPLTPQQQWEKDVRADPVLGPQWDKSNKRIVGGAVLSGISIPFLIGGVALFVAAANAQAVANATDSNVDPLDVTGVGAGLLWASGGITTVIGLGLLIPGGVLLGTGIANRRRVLDAKPKPRASLLPNFGPRGGGLTYTLQF